MTRVDEAANVIRGLLGEIDRNTCPHEDTYRGGFLWTICHGCGRKWADDEGGFVADPIPAAVTSAEAFLDTLRTEEQAR